GGSAAAVALGGGDAEEARLSGGFEQGAVDDAGLLPARPVRNDLSGDELSDALAVQLAVLGEHGSLHRRHPRNRRRTQHLYLLNGKSNDMVGATVGDGLRPDNADPHPTGPPVRTHE